MKHFTIRGIIESGAGKGSYFTQVDWVVSECLRLLGYAPYPGTLNVRVVDADLKYLDAFLLRTDLELSPVTPDFCTARLKQVIVDTISGALIVPAEEVRIHEKRVIEIIAPCHLKKALGLADGNFITVAELYPNGTENCNGRQKRLTRKS